MWTNCESRTPPYGEGKNAGFYSPGGMFPSDVGDSARLQKGEPPPGAPCPSPSAVTLQRPSECVSSFVSSRENNCFSRRATDKRGQLVWAKPQPYCTLPRPLCESILKGDRLSQSFSPSWQKHIWCLRKIKIFMNRQYRKYYPAPTHEWRWIISVFTVSFRCVFLPG